MAISNEIVIRRDNDIIIYGSYLKKMYSTLVVLVHITHIVANENVIIISNH